MGVAPGCARQFTPGGRPRRSADLGRALSRPWKRGRWHNRDMTDDWTAAEGVALPSDVDPELWFVSSHPICRGGRDYLWDEQWHTHPGRMAAYCPHDAEHSDYRISLQGLPGDLPAATRYWVRGFLAGNLPKPPHDAPPNGPEMAAWREQARVFAHEGWWPLDEGEDPVKFVPGH
jgi:hypothetical protein